MKKAITMILTCSLMLTFASCKSDEVDKKDKKKSETTPTLNLSEPPAEVFENLEESSRGKGLDENGMWVGIDSAALFTMFDYNNLQIPKDKYTPTEELLTKKKDEILQYAAAPELEPLTHITDRAVKEGDRVNIDFVGSVDGVEFDGGNSLAGGTSGVYVKAGSNEFIDDFLTQIIGHNPGETMDVNVTFPEGYQEPSLSGKDAVFVVDIHFILDDGELTELVAPLVKKDMVMGFFEEYIFDNVSVTVPDEMLIRYEKNEVEGLTAEAKANGVDLTSYLIGTGLSSDGDIKRYIAERTEDNRKMCKLIIVLQAIAQDLKIEITDADIMDFLKIDEEQLTAYISEFTLPYLKQATMFDKVYLHVMETADYLQ